MLMVKLSRLTAMVVFEGDVRSSDVINPSVNSSEIIFALCLPGVKFDCLVIVGFVESAFVAFAKAAILTLISGIRN